MTLIPIFDTVNPFQLYRKKGLRQKRTATFDVEEIQRLNVEGEYSVCQNAHLVAAEAPPFPKNKHISHIRCHPADFDGNLAEGLLRLKALHWPEPTYVVASGGDDNSGHAYWFYKTPLKVTKRIKRQYTKAQKGIAKALGSDKAICDLSRIMRVPGSIHPETGATCRILQHNPKCVYDGRQLLHFFASDVAQTEEGTDEDPSLEPTEYPWDPSCALPLTLAAMLENGLSDQQCRSQFSLLFIAVCIWHGVDKQHTWAMYRQALMIHPERSNEVSDENWDLIRAEFDRAWKSRAESAHNLYKCSMCGGYHPRSHFHRDKTRSGLTASYCKPCRRDYDRLRKHVRKLRAKLANVQQHLTSLKAKYPGALTYANLLRYSRDPSNPSNSKLLSHLKIRVPTVERTVQVVLEKLGLDQERVEDTLREGVELLVLSRAAPPDIVVDPTPT